MDGRDKPRIKGQRKKRRNVWNVWKPAQSTAALISNLQERKIYKKAQRERNEIL